MESAPLTLAYTHARNAAQETRRSNPVAASEEHDLAATEFASAASSTTDKEAIRVLHLLEQHHKQLAHILKEPHLKAPSTTVDKKHDVSISDKSDESSRSATQPPRLVKAGRSTARNLSSSIASDLASARGIPAVRQKRNVPVSPLVSNDQADATLSQQRREQKHSTSENNAKPSNLPSWTPPQSVTKSVATTAVSNSPFQQFYNRFEGVISTLTAPLAFATLPLVPVPADTKIERPPSPESPRKLPLKASASSVMPDYSQLISDAALRAVRDNNDSGYPRPHESFMIVPTSGGTVSYADITAANYVDRQVSRQRHRREMSTNSNDDFVDASSQILSQPPIPSLLSAQQSGNTADIEKWAGMVKYQGKTLEELHLENQILRQQSNELAKRLFVFESAAQDARLAQSIRGMQLSPITTPENSRGKMIQVSGGHSDGGLRNAQTRIQELEDALRKNDRRLVKRDEENAKLKDTLLKYRDKWEGLKAGAKARREQAGGGDKLRRGSSAATTVTIASIAKDRDRDKDRDSATIAEAS